jgi:hypothetical protein
VGFVVDKVALGQVCLQVLQFSPFNIIPPLLHICSCLIWGMNNEPVSSHRNIVLSHCKNTVTNENVKEEITENKKNVE